jgi:hypothetical protein
MQLSEGTIYGEGWFDPGSVGRLLEQHVAGRRDWTHVLWPLLGLGLWLDRLRGHAA